MNKSIKSFKIKKLLILVSIIITTILLSPFSVEADNTSPTCPKCGKDKNATHSDCGYEWLRSQHNC